MNKKYTEAPFDGPPSLAVSYFQLLTEENLLHPWFMDPKRFKGLDEKKRESLYISYFDFLRNGFTSPRIYAYYFSLRTEIHPALWFYTLASAEPAREAKPFFPRHVLDDTRDNMTLALRFLAYKRDTVGIRTYAKKLDLPIDTLSNIIYKKKVPKEISARYGRPTAPLVKRMMTEIPPEDWFIFPDEIKERKGFARTGGQKIVTPAAIIDYVESAERRKQQ